jgi:hypothetical protein
LNWSDHTGQNPDIPPGQLPVPPTIVPAESGTLPVAPTITGAPDPNNPNGLDIGCGNQGQESCGPSFGDIAGNAVGGAITALGFIDPELSVPLVFVGIGAGYAASKMSVDPNQAFPIYAIPNKE